MNIFKHFGYLISSYRLGFIAGFSFGRIFGLLSRKR